METELLGSMAQRGREKHQILPPFYDPQSPYQSHHEVGWLARQHPVNSSGNNAWADRLLQGSPLRTQGALHLSNRAGDPKYPNYNHPGTKWGSHDTNNARRSGSRYSEVTHRKGSRSRWFHNKLLPLLLPNVKGGSMAAGGGISQLRKNYSSTKCHFPHPNTQRIKGHQFEELQTHSSL